MPNFPKSTEFRRRIPKQKFYENLTLPPALKKQFAEAIKIIYWRNKIAAATTNLAPGKDVTEIEVFEIRLNRQELDEAVLRQIDREIPYHILFLLEYNGRCQAWIGYKQTAGAEALKVSRYFHTDWMAEGDLPLKVDGLNLDAVYENFVRQVAGDALPPGPLQEAIRRSGQRAQLEKQIAALQAKIRREKQLNRQMELNAELKILKKKLEEL